MASGVIDQYSTVYQPRNGHHHRCTVCGGLIQAGESVRVTCYRKEKYYLVKGLMGFNTWHFTHSSCSREKG